MEKLKELMGHSLRVNTTNFNAPKGLKATRQDVSNKDSPLAFGGNSNF
jgi:hypothetical protein